MDSYLLEVLFFIPGNEAEKISKTLATAIVVITVLLMTAIVIAIVVIATICCRKRKQNKENMLISEESYGDTESEYNLDNKGSSIKRVTTDIGMQEKENLAQSRFPAQQSTGVQAEEKL